MLELEREGRRGRKRVRDTATDKCVETLYLTLV